MTTWRLVIRHLDVTNVAMPDLGGRLLGNTRPRLFVKRLGEMKAQSHGKT
jgi:hypothetical protein